MPFAGAVAHALAGAAGRGRPTMTFAGAVAHALAGAAGRGRPTMPFAGGSSLAADSRSGQVVRRVLSARAAVAPGAPGAGPPRAAADGEGKLPADA